MGFRSVLATVILLSLSAVWALPATAQQRSALPSVQHSVQSQSDVEAATLPPVDVAGLKSADDARSDEIRPYRYGTVVDTNYRPDQDGTWEQLPSGNRLWRLRIQSEDAVSLSLGFSRFALPDDASLFVYDPEGTLIRGPYTQADATNGQHWTPLVRGEEIIVELEVPADQRNAVNLVIGSVVHGYRSLFPERDGSSSKAGACNLDVSCEEADPWRDQVRSVARYSFVKNGRASVCSGALVNNTAQDGRLLFLTAEHCVTGPDVANSMTFYWNYQNPTCRTPGTTESGQVTEDDLDDQTSSGALLRARYGSTHETGSIEGKSDVALVEIDDAVPEEYNLYLSGWNRQDQRTQEGTAIHHPQGHGKRISFDDDSSSVTKYLGNGNNGGATHLRIGDWETGTTEVGSSGSPLFNTNQRIVGVLSGGAAGCDNDGDAQDNNRPDWYGRLADGAEKGDYPDGDPKKLTEILAPNSPSQKTLEGRSAVSPPSVSDFRLETVTANSATLEWTSPAVDGSASAPVEYDLRVRPNVPIETAADFQSARQVSKGTLGSAGETESVTIDLPSDTTYYFAIRTIDENKNASKLTTKAASPVTDLRVTRRPGPNPTSGKMTFGVSVKENQFVRATLYDTMGRRVRTLLSEDVPAFRQHSETVNLSDVASGIYFLRIRGESTVRTEKIVITR